MGNTRRGFASDNNAGVHPRILEAMARVNEGHEVAYGDDPYTADAKRLMKGIFGKDSEIFFVFTGTAANVLGLSSAMQSHNAVICPETAHINVDECGAPEKFTGCKLLTVPAPDGKLTVEGIRRHMHGIGVEHHVQPKAVSITQATEMGTLYSLEEISEICAFAHTNDMIVHMDGARISNAAVAMETGFYEMSGGAGVDILSFGGTKNGMMYGEAVVFFNAALADGFKYRRKQGMQLSSKMRFISSQFSAFLEGNLWEENARHANLMAMKLYHAVKDIPGLTITQEVGSNALFVILPPEVIPALQEHYFFYIWNEERSEVRWMCSYDTTEEDVESFASLVRSLLT